MHDDDDRSLIDNDFMRAVWGDSPQQPSSNILSELDKLAIRLVQTLNGENSGDDPYAVLGALSPEEQTTVNNKVETYLLNPAKFATDENKLAQLQTSQTNNPSATGTSSSSSSSFSKSDKDSSPGNLRALANFLENTEDVKSVSQRLKEVAKEIQKELKLNDKPEIITHKEQIVLACPTSEDADKIASATKTEKISVNERYFVPFPNDFIQQLSDEEVKSIKNYLKKVSAVKRTSIFSSETENRKQTNNNPENTSSSTSNKPSNQT